MTAPLGSRHNTQPPPSAPMPVKTCRPDSAQTRFVPVIGGSSVPPVRSTRERRRSASCLQERQNCWDGLGFPTSLPGGPPLLLLLLLSRHQVAPRGKSLVILLQLPGVPDDGVAMLVHLFDLPGPRFAGVLSGGVGLHLLVLLDHGVLVRGQ